MKRLDYSIVALVALAILATGVRLEEKVHAQSIITSNLAGNGTPTAAGWACNAGYNNQLFIQWDATNGHIWICDQSIGSYSWDHQTLPIAGTTVSIGGALLILGGSTSGTASVTGAAIGQVCSANASDGTLPPVGIIIDCAVTGTGIVTVRLSAAIAGTPAAKTYNVRLLS